MELTEKDRAILNDLFQIAWQAGAIKSPQMGLEVEQVRMKLLGPKAPENAAPKGKPDVKSAAKP